MTNYSPPAVGGASGEITPAFSRAEYMSRLAGVQADIRAGGHDALLLFIPESVTWLTGFYTRAYSSFQFVIVPADGEPTVICRDMEQYYLDRSSIFQKRAVWTDSDEPLSVGLFAIQRAVGKRPKLAVELSAWTLSAARYRALIEAFPDAVISDASSLISTKRLIKSPAEIEYQRKAGQAAAAGMQAAAAAACAGASERDLAAAICSAMITSGSDSPGPGVLSSGERAYHLHGAYGDRMLEVGDIVQLEAMACVRQYHARFMRPISVGPAREDTLRAVEKLVAIQDAALAVVAPDVEASVPDAIYREGVLSSGLAKKYTNKTFYSVGLLFPPAGGENLEATPQSAWRFKAGMVFHSYVLAGNLGMSETIAITDTGYERLTTFPRQLLTSG
ncbi:Xaa-Pro peptidase family protein [Acetobacter sp. DsW_063]|uniref:M24 family metallopeptidase n=1 Tax=Acetobacter sp. DsW_063 TaxID=1514894 RepID=UPI000A3A8503|nr:Xaa-Pro peptidase family protein [Acetobacter sp. DsW_063]